MRHLLTLSDALTVLTATCLRRTGSHPGIVDGQQTLLSHKMSKITSSSLTARQVLPTLSTETKF